MQAIEFETYLQNGFIQLPNTYQHWQVGNKVKVIILGEEITPSTEKKTLSCLDLIKDDIGIIEDAPSDLSTNPAYLDGYGE